MSTDDRNEAVAEIIGRTFYRRHYSLIPAESRALCREAAELITSRLAAAERQVAAIQAVLDDPRMGGSDWAVGFRAALDSMRSALDTAGLGVTPTAEEQLQAIGRCVCTCHCPPLLPAGSVAPTEPPAGEWHDFDCGPNHGGGYPHWHPGAAPVDEPAAGEWHDFDCGVHGGFPHWHPGAGSAPADTSTAESQP